MSDDKMREALKWYASKAAACRKITDEGEEARNALDKDGGELARLALCDSQQQPKPPRKQFLCTRCGTTFDAVGEEEVKEAFKAASEHDKRCQGRPCDSQQQAGEPVAEVTRAAESVITSTCRDAVEKLKEVAPHMGWDSGEANAEIRLREFHRKLGQKPRPDWVPCSERLPTEDDADCGDYGSHTGNVWFWRKGRKYAVLKPWTWIYPITGDYWKPTGLTRPQPPEGES